MSDGEELQAVLCGPRGLGESGSWDLASVALGLGKNVTQMKVGMPAQSQELYTQKI